MDASAAAAAFNLLCCLGLRARHRLVESGQQHPAAPLLLHWMEPGHYGAVGGSVPESWGSRQATTTPAPDSCDFALAWEDDAVQPARFALKASGWLLAAVSLDHGIEVADGWWLEDVEGGRLSPRLLKLLRDSANGRSLAASR